MVGTPMNINILNCIELILEVYIVIKYMVIIRFIPLILINNVIDIKN